MSNPFEEHANITAQKLDDQKWDFNANEARQVREDVEWKNYRDSWNDKWQIVKDIMCGEDYHNAEELDKVLDIAGRNDD